MWGNKGFTLIEIMLSVVLISTILLLIASTSLIYINSWDLLKDTGERDYALRTVSSFLYKEVKMIDKDKAISTSNNSVLRGNRLNYTLLDSTSRNYIDSFYSASSGLTSMRKHTGSYSRTIADEVTFIHFTISDELLYVTFRLKNQEYELVIPWD